MTAPTSSTPRPFARLHRWWVQVPQPRDLSIAYACLYGVALATGVFALTDPPRSIVSNLGGSIMPIMGVLLIVGSCAAAWGGYLEHWQMERVGITICALAIAFYGYLVLGAQLSSDGSRVVQLGVIVMALGAFVIRYLSIRGFTYKPRG